MNQNINDTGQDKATDPCPPQSIPMLEACRSRIARMFDHFASGVARATGSPVAFACAMLAIFVWALAGPSAGFSEVWQLVVNTGTTIVTFLMVFLIQQNQNKDSRAVHVKLDELLIALKGANEKLVDIEDMEEDEINRVAARYRRLAVAARDGRTLNRAVDGTVQVADGESSSASRRKRQGRRPARGPRGFKAARREG
ncbi:low affinity iron permease family protein [Bordetella sp. 15P40C-2]|uniref:low affinity iron permease family protein n=1 Tax=Bordetella sp. 15P40C-2 TaxID=2572246 RepID=UPI001F3D52F7|nr:low affinity iron permease family protein [Bordetella sp. 15P40C-2]